MKKILFILAVLFLLFVIANPAQAARPNVVSTDPFDEATGVHTGTAITITFDMGLDTVLAQSTTEVCGSHHTNCHPLPDYIRVENMTTGQYIYGTVLYTPFVHTITFTPESILSENTQYEVTVVRDIRSSDMNGHERMLANYVFQFTTGSSGVSDHISPTIDLVSPAHNATGIALTSKIDARFSESVKAPVGWSLVFTVSTDGSAIAGTVTYDSTNMTATFSPTGGLLPNKLYTAIITTGVTDLADNPLDISNSPIATFPPAYTWTFRTISTDVTPPTVDAVTPLNNGTGVGTDAIVVATFSEAIDPATITSTNFTLTKSSPNVTITGTLTYDPAQFQLVFTPNAGQLLNSITYTAKIKGGSTGVKDVAGNALASDYSWVFTTAAAVVPAAMENYCQTPPFITTNARVKPNVLVLSDNSGSMNEFAYKASGLGSSEWDSSYNSAGSYYGYFDSAHMYKYTSTGGGYFEIDNTKTLDKTDFWSGNFLNWLSMRRIDIVRKVLVGGKMTPRSGNQPNYVQGLSNVGTDSRKTYGGNYYKLMDGSSAGKIRACGTSSGCSSGYTDYNVVVYVGNNPPDEGILVKMRDRINFGIMFFNDGYRYEDNKNMAKDGGYVAVDIGSTGTDLITQIENTEPGNYTPLAESLYESTRYFEADVSAYNGGTYNGKDPIAYPCQKNFVLIVTDGESTKDRNLPGTTFTGIGYGSVASDVSGGNFNVGTWMDKIATMEGYASQKSTVPPGTNMDGSYYLEGVAYYAHTTDLRRGASDPLGPLGKSDISGTQNLTVYAVYVFDDSSFARDILQKAAKYGGFAEKDGTFGPSSPGEWDKNGDGVPDNYFEAQDGNLIGPAIQSALNDILAQVSSGTATSILSSSEGSGANIMQAIFYPKRTFSASSEVDWIGEVQNMWYYLDPRVNNSSVREDTTHDFTLNLFNDYVIKSRYDTSDQTTKVDRSRAVDTNSDGAPDSEVAVDTISLDSISSLWRAGKKLMARDIRVCSNNAGTACSTDLNCVSPGTCTGGFSGSERTIYTTLDSATLSDFRALDTTNATVLSLLQAANSTEAAKIINYTHGVDQSGYRSRNVKVCSGNDTIYCASDATCSSAGAGTCLSRTWKLGDVVSSTPKVQSNFALNNFYKSYGDKTYDAFVQSAGYKSRGMVFTGANDGMLHAFNFGTLDVKSSTYPNIAKICQDDNGNTLCDAAETTTTTLGKEQWSFIPKNVLPYLKYMADPLYCHLFTVDLSPTIFDASIGDTGCDLSTLTPAPVSPPGYWDCPKKRDDGTPYGTERWRTVLIGGMRLGGGCKAAATTNGVGVPVSGAGYSSYFALDVTDPTSPTLLWEFVPPSHDMGFASSGPAIVRINARVSGEDKSTPNKDRNGRWLAVFASGPTGPIDTTYGQFKGFSDQPLKLFVVDVKTGDLVRTITTFADGTSLPANAFGGSMANANIDYDIDYQDDALYFGYTKAEVATPDNTTKWNAGGVLRLVTKSRLDGNAVSTTALNPFNWEVSKLIDDVGPVTAAVAHMAHYPQRVGSGSTIVRPDRGYLFFGTGRYYYTIDTGSDDTTTQRRIYGVKEPCLDKIAVQSPTSYGSCPAFDTGTLADTSMAIPDTSYYLGTNIDLETDLKSGWYLDLEAATGSLYAERIITDPMATTMGIVFVTSFAPSTEVCSFGGKSYLWGLRFDSGGSVNGLLKGKALMQVSTGAIEEINLNTGFIQSGQRRTAAMSGAPPTGMGLAIVTQPPPTNRMQHLRKK